VDYFWSLICLSLREETWSVTKSPKPFVKVFHSNKAVNSQWASYRFSHEAGPELGRDQRCHVVHVGRGGQQCSMSQDKHPNHGIFINFHDF
jgi:hypothetical protein